VFQGGDEIPAVIRGFGFALSQIRIAVDGQTLQ